MCVLAESTLRSICIAPLPISRQPPTLACPPCAPVAEHNPQVSYCQSMNFLAAMLLLVVDEETAFWALAAVVERLMPGHFSSSMAMALVDQGVLSEFLAQEDAELVAHLEQLQVAPSLVTTQWLLTCFVGSALPLGALLRIWDAFFTERHISFLFRVAAALLTTSRTALLAATDTGDAYILLTALGSELDETSADALLDTAHALRSQSMLEPLSLASLRRKHAEKLETEHSFDASQVARAAVATATATDAELQQLGLSDAGACGSGYEYSTSSYSACPTVGTSASGWLAAGKRQASERGVGDWAIVPASTGGSRALVDGSADVVSTEESGSAEDPADEWSLLEWSLVEPLPPPTPSSSLSYVILQLEAPKILEEHFGKDGSAVSRNPAEAAAARLDALA